MLRRVRMASIVSTVSPWLTDPSSGRAGGRRSRLSLGENRIVSVRTHGPRQGHHVLRDEVTRKAVAAGDDVPAAGRQVPYETAHFLVHSLGAAHAEEIQVYVAQDTGAVPVRAFHLSDVHGPLLVRMQ